MIKFRGGGGYHKVAKKFNSPEQTTDFTLKFYKDFVDKELSVSEQNRIGMIQASGRYSDEPMDAICIEAIEKCFIKCPLVPYDIVAYRAGRMHFDNRPYISASLLLSTAKKYNNKFGKIGVHKIIVKKEAKVFPLRALDKDYGDQEAEIIISSKKLKRRFGYYLYK